MSEPGTKKPMTTSEFFFRVCGTLFVLDAALFIVAGIGGALGEAKEFLSVLTFGWFGALVVGIVAAIWERD